MQTIFALAVASPLDGGVASLRVSFGASGFAVFSRRCPADVWAVVLETFRFSRIRRLQLNGLEPVCLKSLLQIQANVETSVLDFQLAIKRLHRARHRYAIHFSLCRHVNSFEFRARSAVVFFKHWLCWDRVKIEFGANFVEISHQLFCWFVISVVRDAVSTASVFRHISRFRWLFTRRKLTLMRLYYHCHHIVIIFLMFCMIAMNLPRSLMWKSLLCLNGSHTFYLGLVFCSILFP